MNSTVKTLLILLAALSVLKCSSPATQPIRSKTALDRIQSRGEIRCAYVSYPPYAIKDPNSGGLSGIFIEVLEEVGRRLGLRVNWVEEVGFGNVFEGFNSDRYDILGSGLWQNSSRSKAAYFTLPIFYNPVTVWGKPGDKSRFLNRAEAINDPRIRISVQDGAIEDLIATRDFPRAQKISVPQLNQWSDVLLNITTGKADLTFAEPAAVLPFLDKNPGALVEIPQQRPARVFANAYAIKFGESELKAVLDGTINEILNDGTVDRILRKYEKTPNEYYRVAPPYIDPNSTKLDILKNAA